MKRAAKKKNVASSAGEEEIPSVDVLLAEGGWEQRLEEARRQREQALARQSVAAGDGAPRARAGDEAVPSVDEILATPNLNDRFEKARLRHDKLAGRSADQDPSGDSLLAADVPQSRKETVLLALAGARGRVAAPVAKPDMRKPEPEPRVVAPFPAEAGPASRERAKRRIAWLPLLGLLLVGLVAGLVFGPGRALLTRNGVPDLPLPDVTAQSETVAALPQAEGVGAAVTPVTVPLKARAPAAASSTNPLPQIAGREPAGPVLPGALPLASGGPVVWDAPAGNLNVPVGELALGLPVGALDAGDALVVPLGTSAVLPEIPTASAGFQESLSGAQKGRIARVYLNPGEALLPTMRLDSGEAPARAGSEVSVIGRPTTSPRPSATSGPDEVPVVAALRGASAQVSVTRVETPSQDVELAPGQFDSGVSDGRAPELLALATPAADLSAAVDAVPPAPAKPDTSGYSIYVHAPSTVKDATLQGLLSALRDTGYDVGDAKRVDFTISKTNVRYFHPEDRKAAADLAKLADAKLRDFTGFRPSPPVGAIEIWVQGEGVKRTARPRMSVRPDPLVALRNRLVQRLRNRDYLPSGGN